MSNGAPPWRVVPYEEASSFKKMRVRDEARVRTVVRRLMNDECVALLGPPMSEKSRFLRDVADELLQSGRFRPLHIDLWRTRSNDEAAFFTSLADLVASELGTPHRPLLWSAAKKPRTRAEFPGLSGSGRELQ